MLSRAPDICAILILAALLVACDTRSDSVNDQVSFSRQLMIHIDDQGELQVVPIDAGETLEGAAARDYIATTLSEDPSTLVVISSDPVSPSEAVDQLLALLRENEARSVAIAASTNP